MKKALLGVMACLALSGLVLTKRDDLVAEKTAKDPFK
jgi:hypothetical protein